MIAATGTDVRTDDPVELFAGETDADRVGFSIVNARTACMTAVVELTLDQAAALERALGQARRRAAARGAAARAAETAE